MKRIYPEGEEVTQRTANVACNVIQRHLNAARVTDTMDLSDQEKVALYRELDWVRKGETPPPAWWEKIPHIGKALRLVGDFLTA